MAEFPSLPLWTDAWVADTKHLSRAERGLYMDLLILMWRSATCKVPNDDAWLAKRLNLTEKEVTGELRPIISEFCISDGNRIWQKRLFKEYEFCRRQSARRKGKKTNDKDTNRNEFPDTAPTPTPIPTLTKEKAPLAFEGKIVRLKSEHHAAWKRAYRNIAGNLDGLLQQRDDWLVAQPPSIQKQWYISTSNWLASKDAEAAAKTGPPKKSLGPAAGTPEDIEQRRRAGI